MKSIEYMGLRCLEMTFGQFSIIVTESVGLRVISLRFDGGVNLFAELPGVKLESPDAGSYHFYGGHRLWHAPEDPRITYLPDDQPVKVEPIEEGISLTQPVEVKTGIQKEMQIRFDESVHQLKISHVLRNLGENSVTLAPWAITQLTPGGIAVLPQFTGLSDGNGTLPNRSITLWPYTNINSPHIEWGNKYILVRADMENGKLKIGYPNREGWLAYWRGPDLFIKRSDYRPGEPYFDFGSSSECYCDPRFLELETLGPITTISSGESVTHQEIWEVHRVPAWSGNISELDDFFI